MTSKALIIPAAGAGKRMQREKAKPFLSLGEKTILGHSLQPFLQLEGLQRIVVATSADYLESASLILKQEVPLSINWQVVEGGFERQHSIHKALDTVSDEAIVLVHDAVRPFVSVEHIEQCCREAEKEGAAILGIPSKNTIKEVDTELFVESTPDRSRMWQVQTPQVFRTELLKEAYKRAADEGFMGTDDASLVEWMGKSVKMVEGSTRNFKLTYPTDLKLAKLMIEEDGNE